MSTDLAEFSKQELATKLKGALARVSNIAKKGEEKVGGLIIGAEVVGGAFAVSWVCGKFGKNGVPLQIMNMPADGVIGGGLFVAGWLGLAGRHSEHLLNLGAGAIAAYAGREGYNIGWQTNDTNPQKGSVVVQMNPAPAAGWRPQPQGARQAA